MSQNKIAVLVASILTVVWVCIFGFVNFWDDPSTPLLLSPGTLTLITLLLVPAVLIWLAAASVATSIQTDNRLWRLESDIRNIRSQLSNGRRIRDQGNHHERLGDPVGVPQDDEVASVQPSEGQQTVEEGGDLQTDADPPAADTPTEQYEEIVSNSVLIRALNFAEDDRDVAGIAAVETAARIPEVADLLNSSMRVLELFADIGITVDQMSTQLSNPDDWRNAALAETGRPFTGLYQILDRRFATAVRTARQGNPEFADASRDLRERATAMLEKFAQDADDNEIIGLLNTRTYRSFILLDHADA